MSWQVVAASATGTSHIAAGDVCQDSCLVLAETYLNKEPLLSMFVADGAGSAMFGGVGAELAVETGAAFIAHKFNSPDIVVNEELAAECFVAVRNRLFAQAEKDGFDARDYACTFLCVFSSDRGTVVIQIGDGGIVLDVGNGLEVPVVPMSGEYANMTHFITDEDAINFYESKIFSSKAIKVAMFSDGLQRLALNIATNTAHEPFFIPFFTALSNATSDQQDLLHDALVTFLNSPSVNERTDDDKTLALAVLVD